MLTVYGEGRGFRVVWLLEELGVAYRLRPVDLAAVENDREFLEVNPAGFIPALQDGATIMVESIAIMEYLLARHGAGSLAVAPDDAAYAAYLQFLHLGEAGLAGPMNAVIVGRNMAPEAEREARVTRWARATFESRLALVIRRLAECAYLAGERFTAADISVSYALLLGLRTGNYVPGLWSGSISGARRGGRLTCGRWRGARRRRLGRRGHRGCRPKQRKRPRGRACG